MDDTYTIILNEGPDFYQFNLNDLFQEKSTSDEDSDLQSLELDSKYIINNTFLDELKPIWNEETLESRIKSVQVYQHKSGQIFAEML